MSEQQTTSSVSATAIVVGGGLAGISAALALAKQGLAVTLLESKHRLGGRAGSYFDPVTEEWVDYCQHVGMACCTNLRQLIQWLGQQEYWQVQKELHFFGPDGQYQKLKSIPYLPAPLHLASWLWNWPGLGMVDRLQVGLCLRKLDGIRADDQTHQLSANQWLVQQKQSPVAVERFWKTVVVSSLGEELGRVSLAAIAKVFQDGFMRHREAFHLLVPVQPLRLLFGELAIERLRESGVDVRTGCTVQSLLRNDAACHGVVLSDGTQVRARHTVVAIPWYAWRTLVPAENERLCSDPLHSVAYRASQLASSPISGVHTWWDQPWLDVPHAVLIDRLCQWVFPKLQAPALSKKIQEHEFETCQPHGHYYQIVISASRQLPDRANLSMMLQSDLSAVFPQVARAKLLRLKVISDPHAVFSINTAANSLRPQTCLQDDSLLVAGDWVRTGWPATMESAVLSGFMAAEEILKSYNISIPVQANPLALKSR